MGKIRPGGGHITAPINSIKNIYFTFTLSKIKFRSKSHICYYYFRPNYIFTMIFTVILDISIYLEWSKSGICNLKTIARPRGARAPLRPQMV